jgi:hypothetical protein
MQRRPRPATVIRPVLCTRGSNRTLLFGDLRVQDEHRLAEPDVPPERAEDEEEPVDVVDVIGRDALICVRALHGKMGITANTSAAGAEK